jgi:hypothetical protein
MKKSCFIQVIIFLTILTAAIVYFIDNHFQDVVVNPGKKMISGMILDEFDEKYKEKDSLKVILNELLLDKKNNDKNYSFENYDELFDSIDFIFRDSLIDKSEIFYVKKITGSDNER